MSTVIQKKKEMYLCFSITQLELSFELLVFQKAELLASTSGSHGSSLQGALTVLRNVGEGHQALGCHHPSTLTPPRPCALHTLRAWFLQDTAMSTFWGSANSFGNGLCLLCSCSQHYSGACRAWGGGVGGLSQASPCQLNGSLGPYCCTGTH